MDRLTLDDFLDRAVVSTWWAAPLDRRLGHVLCLSATGTLVGLSGLWCLPASALAASQSVSWLLFVVQPLLAPLTAWLAEHRGALLAWHVGSLGAQLPALVVLARVLASAARRSCRS